MTGYIQPGSAKQAGLTKPEGASCKKNGNTAGRSFEARLPDSLLPEILYNQQYVSLKIRILVAI